MPTAKRPYLQLCICALVVAASLVFNGYAILHSGPQVVVYLDKDAKQPAMLPLPDSSKVMTGERAAFWWTVFCKAQESQFVDAAEGTAARATRTVYGDVK